MNWEKILEGMETSWVVRRKAREKETRGEKTGDGENNERRNEEREGGGNIENRKAGRKE